MCDMEMKFNIYVQTQQFREAMNNFVSKIPSATQTEGKNWLQTNKWHFIY